MSNHPDMYVYLIPSVMCNLRHTFCFQKSFSTQRLSDDILYRKLLPLYPKIKCLRLHGGELTIIPGMQKYVEFLGENYPAMQINIVTNGVKFNDKWIELVSKYNITINFSLNATTSKITQSILSHTNGDNIYKSIRENLDKLHQLHCKSQRNIVNTITMAVCEETADDVENFALFGLERGLNIMFQFPCQENAVISPKILNAVKEAIKMKVLLKDYINIKLIHAPLQSKLFDIYDQIEQEIKVMKINKGELFDKLSFAPKRAKQYEIYTYESLENAGDNVFKCKMGENGLFISSTGDIFPCSNMSNVTLGNIYYQSINEILDSTARAEVIEEINQNNYKYCWERCNCNYYPETTIRGSSLCGYKPQYIESFDNGEYKKVVEFFDENLVPEQLLAADALYKYAFSLQMTGMYEAALKNYKLAFEKGFSEFWIRYNRGTLYKKLGRMEEALEDLERAIEIDSEHEGAQQILKDLLENQIH